MPKFLPNYTQSKWVSIHFHKLSWATRWLIPKYSSKSMWRCVRVVSYINCMKPSNILLMTHEYLNQTQTLLFWEDNYSCCIELDDITCMNWCRKIVFHPTGNDIHYFRWIFILILHRRMHTNHVRTYIHVQLTGLSSRLSRESTSRFILKTTLKCFFNLRFWKNGSVKI